MGVIRGQVPGVASFPEIGLTVAECTNWRRCARPRGRLMIAEWRLLIVEVGILPSQINNRLSSIDVQLGQPA